MKPCTRCGEVKPLDDFYRDRRASDGCTPHCKVCACAATRRWQVENPERVKVAQRAYYLAHRQEYIDRAKAYHREHHGKRLAQIQEWQDRNPDRRRKTQQKLYRKNPEYERERSLRYYEANKHRWRAYSATRRARQGSSTPEMRAFILELVQQPCVYCGAADSIEVDHIVPLARGGTHTSENLAPACGPCNRSKGAKLLSEWKVAA